MRDAISAPVSPRAVGSVTVLSFLNTDEPGAVFSHVGTDTLTAVRTALEASWPTPDDASDEGSHGRIVAHLSTGDGPAALAALTQYLSGWYTVREEVLQLHVPTLRPAPAEPQASWEQDFLVDVDLDMLIDSPSLYELNQAVEKILENQGDLPEFHFLTDIDYTVIGRGDSAQEVRLRVSAVVVNSASRDNGDEP
jgi:hypothetical protein